MILLMLMSLLVKTSVILAKATTHFDVELLTLDSGWSLCVVILAAARIHFDVERLTMGPGSIALPRGRTTNYLTCSRAHLSRNAAISRLFFSSIIMCPLPWMCRSVR